MPDNQCVTLVSTIPDGIFENKKKKIQNLMTADMEDAVTNET